MCLSSQTQQQPCSLVLCWRDCCVQLCRLNTAQLHGKWTVLPLLVECGTSAAVQGIWLIRVPTVGLGFPISPVAVTPRQPAPGLSRGWRLGFCPRCPERHRWAPGLLASHTDQTVGAFRFHLNLFLKQKHKTQQSHLSLLTSESWPVAWGRVLQTPNKHSLLPAAPPDSPTTDSCWSCLKGPGLSGPAGSSPGCPSQPRATARPAAPRRVLGPQPHFAWL